MSRARAVHLVGTIVWLLACGAVTARLKRAEELPVVSLGPILWISWAVVVVISFVALVQASRRIEERDDRQM